MKKNQVRIIGGFLRGRKITFPNIPELRPTPDRVKETIFNWLSPYIIHAQCLDLFAGSGALGFEALSRGAKKVVLLEQNLECIKKIKENVEILQLKNCSIFQAEALSWLRESHAPFDIIFLDPPYKKNLIYTCFDLIEQHALIKKNGFIYCELDTDILLKYLPSHWEMYKHKKAGLVHYSLIKNNPALR